ncbi:AAA family ATPase [Pannus brasiliensis CCIBt3594]|uniref:AAA family ATPase n=1 Tax=Pannus brasiliensis CCIBt3594 TaxID=1427578 RepID=A0AAW9QR55_9CHRO
MTFTPRHCHNEREVESKLIVQYLLPRLGYSADCWYQQVIHSNIRLDFLVSAYDFAAGKKPSLARSLIIEAKHPKENLNNHSHRLKHYLHTVKVPWGILTNGHEIRLYWSDKNDIHLLFRCSGLEIEKNLDKLKDLIGREKLLAKSQPLIIPKTTPKLPMKTIAIYHHKGGVGKTTVATNLAAAFSKQGKRVLLIDIDAQANSTFAVGLIKFQFDEDDDLRDKNVYHLLENNRTNFIPDIARKSQGFTQIEIDVIPSHVMLIEKQIELVQRGGAEIRLAKKLEKVVDDYDIVIIDAPPSLDLYARVALIAADYLIVPSDLKPFSNQGLKGVQKLIDEEINDFRDTIGRHPLKILGVLPSKISPHPQYLQYTFPKQRQAIIDHYQLPLLDTVISERIALSHCVNQNITVGTLQIPDPRSIIDYAETQSSASISASEFQALAIEVLDKMAVV